MSAIATAHIYINPMDTVTRKERACELKVRPPTKGWPPLKRTEGSGEYPRQFSMNNPYLQPRRRALNPWLIRIPILMMLGMLLLAVLLIALVGAFYISYAGKITPGVSALGIDLGGLTRDEAVRVLDQQFTYPDDAVFRLQFGDHTWSMTAGELGVTFDAVATIDQAMALSSDDDPFSDLFDQAMAWFNGYAVTPIVHYDQNVALAQLQAIRAELDQPAQNATLAIEGTNILITPSQVGRLVDVDRTLLNLNAYILALHTSGDIPLYVYEAAPTVWNVDEAAGKVQAALSGPLELYADSPDSERLGPWIMSVDQIKSLLNLELRDNGDGTQSYQVDIDMSAFAGFLEQLAPGLIAAPQDARFHFDEVSRQLIVLRPAVNGRELNVEQTLLQLEQAVFRYDSRSVPMAFDYTLPTYYDGVVASELGITEMVAEATTYYNGSSGNRRHNISHGAALLDGVIIGPGEEFSFNDNLGDISVEAGFVEGKVIVGGRTVDGVGGGICQVSTTAFRAAFYGGFPIIERNTHAYRVGYYELNAPPGLDAAIWSPERDFRFQNDTPYHLLIETSVYPADNSIQFRLYSTHIGRMIEVEEPSIRNLEPALPTEYIANQDLTAGQILQVDYAAEGADVNVKRTVRNINGEIVSEINIFTHYLPWAAVYEVSPTDGRLNS